MSISRRAILTAAAASTLAGPVAALFASPAPAARLAPRATSWVDPYAVAASTPTGKAIKALSASNGLLYPGYGDWAANIGPIPIHSLNPATGQFSGQLLSLPGETTERQRVFNGSVYVLNVDPKTYYEGGQPFASAASGAWTMSGWTNVLHSLDLTVLADGTIIVGGAYIDGADHSFGRVVYFSYDGGVTWKAVCQRGNTDPYARVYHVVNTAGGVLIGVEDGTLLKWTGLRPTDDWNTWDSTYVSPVAARTTVAWNEPTCSNGQVALFGSKFAHSGSASWAVPNGFTAVNTDGDWIYAATSKQLWRTKDAHSWQYASTGVTVTATALAILGTNAYLGTAGSEIVEVPMGRIKWRPATY